MRRTREKNDPAIACAPPPVGEGTDAVARWAQELGTALVGEAVNSRTRGVRAALDALGRVRGAARDCEALLRALEQRGEEVESAAGPEAPRGEIALALWQWYEVARLCAACCTAPDVLVPELLAQAKGLCATIRVRPTAEAEEARRRHRLPRDAREAVREHEEVSAKLAEEALDEEAVDEARRSLVGFGRWMQAHFLAPPHIQLMAQALEEVEAGRCTRLIVMCPPRSGKSNLVSYLFATWYAAKHPNRDVMLGSHSQEKADDWGRDIRNAICSEEFRRVFPHVRVSPDSSAAHRFGLVADEDWRDEHGRKGGSRLRRGQVKSFGRNAGPTGSGANLLILDDLTHEKEAVSDAVKRECKRAVQAFRSRLAPKSEGAAWVIVNTRYAQDDTVGFVLEEYAADGPWTVIKFPELAAEEENWALPDGSVWHRDPGDPLWPERYSKQEIEALRDVLLRTNPMEWWGQRMCSPVPATGAVIDVSRLRRYQDIDVVRAWASRVVVSVDSAKGTGNARTAIGAWLEVHGRGDRDGFYLAEVVAEPGDFVAQKKAIKTLCAKWKANVLLIEDKSTGESLIPQLRADSDWVRTPIKPVLPSKDKLARMSAETPQVAAGQVWVPLEEPGWCEHKWLGEYIQELTFFPNGKRKDCVDMTSQALAWRRTNPLQVQGGPLVSSPQVQKAFGGAWGFSGGGSGRRSRW